ncbi:MAG: NAD(P)-dependent oxidoreductase [SAR202 cluster bacterium]|nr:NAD(P)-dependent oxidoreductase [SAR202 cluster bacterium]
MKVLLLGSNGFMGPHVIKALRGLHDLSPTDVRPPPPEFSYEWEKVDVTDAGQVADAAQGMDSIVYLAVLRHDPATAFAVNTIGTYNMMAAAVQHGIKRIVNTGPQSVVTGMDEWLDHAINPDSPVHSDTRVYGTSKALGHEIARIFTENHDLYVTTFLYSHFRGTTPRHEDPTFWKPFTVAREDASELIRLALEIPLERLPSRFESYFPMADVPHGQYLSDKAKRVFGWQPKVSFEEFWKRPTQ